MNLHLDPTKRHDAVLLVDITDGNPNGDPDMANQPRIDPETRQGLMTDACIKRKLRNYVQLVGEGKEGLSIMIEQGSVLRDRFKPAFDALKIPVSKGKKTTPEQQQELASWLQQQYWDLRMFGGVLESELRAGQVWGPVQIGIARSISPIFSMTMTVTRCAATNPKDGKDNKTMGKRELIPYGLYRAYLTYSPHRAASSVTSDDLQLLWDGLSKCWDIDRSSIRGFMNCRELSIFTHEGKYGNAPAHKLFDLITVNLKDSGQTPRKFDDYDVTVDEKSLPNGVSLVRYLENFSTVN
jgi:CRISPR-associated protein Csd2